MFSLNEHQAFPTTSFFLSSDTELVFWKPHSFVSECFFVFPEEDNRQTAQESFPALTATWRKLSGRISNRFNPWTSGISHGGRICLRAAIHIWLEPCDPGEAERTGRWLCWTPLWFSDFPLRINRSKITSCYAKHGGDEAMLRVYRRNLGRLAQWSYKEWKRLSGRSFQWTVRTLCVHTALSLTILWFTGLMLSSWEWGNSSRDWDQRLP